MLVHKLLYHFARGFLPEYYFSGSAGICGWTFSWSKPPFCTLQEPFYQCT